MHVPIHAQAVTQIVAVKPTQNVLMLNQMIIIIVADVTKNVQNHPMQIAQNVKVENARSNAVQDIS